MATLNTGTYARHSSTYLDYRLEVERSAVDICEDVYEKALKALWRELSKELRDHEAICKLLYDASEAESRLCMARMDLEEAEQAA